MADNLHDWLTACIAEDTVAAMAADDVELGAWPTRESACGLDEEHIALHAPTRVLREVARNRRVLERHAPDRVNSVVTVCKTRCTVRETRENLTERVPQHWPCDEIRDLASIYKDRDGYRTEWGPTDA